MRQTPATARSGTARERVAVFLDYSNVQRTAASVFLSFGVSDDEGHIDPSAIGELLVSKRDRDSDLARVFVYRGAPHPHRQPASATAHDRQVQRWTRDPRVRVTSRPLAYRDGPHGHVAVEKGVDVSLAVDLATATQHDFDTAIVFSRNRDLMPALEMVQRRRSVHLEVASWVGTGSLGSVNGRSVWCHYLDGRDFTIVRDQQRYLAA